jgi:hypothetical protein
MLCFTAITAIVYVTICLRNYWRLPPVKFNSRNASLFCQTENGDTVELKQLQWQDWGFIFVLYGYLNGYQSHWFWLSHQLNECERREMRLMIRSHQNKVCRSMPSITTNPVL